MLNLELAVPHLLLVKLLYISRYLLPNHKLLVPLLTLRTGLSFIHYILKLKLRISHIFRLEVMFVSPFQLLQDIVVFILSRLILLLDCF